LKAVPPNAPERVTFVMRAENKADVLVRVAMLFHRLNLPIEALRVEWSGGRKTMRMSVTVDTEQERAHRIEASDKVGQDNGTAK
jgi:acetolactate synthase small subunit